MKKITCLLIIFITIALCKSNVLAVGESVENTDGNGYKYKTVTNYASPDSSSSTATIYSNYKICLYKEGDDRLRYVTCVEYNGEFILAQFSDVRNTKTIKLSGVNGQYLNIYLDGYMNDNQNFLYGWGFLIYPNFHETFNPDMPVFDNETDAIYYCSTRDIDFSWSNVKYDMTVPTPKIKAFWIDVNNHSFTNGAMAGQLGYEVPFAYRIMGNDNVKDYYVYIDIKFWTPISGKLKAENGFVTFIPESMTSLGELAYYEFSDQIKATDHSWEINFNGNFPREEDIRNKWMNLRHNLENGTNQVTPMKYETNLTGESRTNAIQQANEALRNAALYGNRVRIRACYWYLDGNDMIRCGNFTEWYSTQPTENTVQNIADLNNNQGNEATGVASTIPVESVVNDVENPSPYPPLNINGLGTNVNVTVNNGNQQVPNNQNYPTVVTYNHDNIFTAFVGTYNDASSMLGDFSNFVASTFVWIPTQIWILISMGFAMAIVIMIIKIL